MHIMHNLITYSNTSLVEVHNGDLNRSEIAHLILLMVLTLQNLYLVTELQSKERGGEKQLIALDMMIDVNARVPNWFGPNWFHCSDPHLLWWQPLPPWWMWWRLRWWYGRRIQTSKIAVWYIYHDPAYPCILLETQALTNAQYLMRYGFVDETRHVSIFEYFWVEVCQWTQMGHGVAWYSVQAVNWLNNSAFCRCMTSFRLWLNWMVRLYD